MSDKYYIFDTETDGNQESQNMVQLSVADSDNKMVFNEYVRPPSPQLPVAIAIHGLTDEFLSDKINGEKIYNYIMSDMVGSDSIFVAQNIQFDIDVVNNFLKRCESAPFFSGEPATFDPKGVDTIRLAKHFIKQSELGSFRLDALYVFLFPDKVDFMIKSRAKHDALVDCQMTNDVLLEIGKRYMNTTNINKLYEQANKPYLVDEWYMGKYKGRKIEDATLDNGKLDVGYIYWAKSNLKEEHPDLIWTLEQKGL